MKSHLASVDWEPPSHWRRITTFDMHTGGEPLRIFITGLPPIYGTTVLEKRRYFRDHHDFLRTGVLWEPRGHADMYGAILTPSLDADFDVIFLHNEGYSTMCGHAIIALATFVVETGLIDRPADDRGRRSIDVCFSVPAGRIEARATLEGGRVSAVSFRNVPSFLYLQDQDVDVPGIGRVHFDVAYGGAFYALVDAGSLGLELELDQLSRLIDVGRRIKWAVMAQFPIEHPFESDLSFLYGTILTGPPRTTGHHSRNVCIFAEGEVDRSATGSGVSARAATHHANGELGLNETVTIESILGSTLTVRAVEQVQFGGYEAIVPEVSGTAFITGRSQFYFDPDDPFRDGFIIR